ncbi:MAG: S8 family serine peptidase [Candidatus Hydrogenedentes bacterium]|nr:S8 family serine peptidase [Candidatus Hydrogenedentota bacterium]
MAGRTAVATRGIIVLVTVMTLGIQRASSGAARPTGYDAVAPDWQERPAEATYYGWRGVRTPLYLSSGRVGITFEPGVTADAMRSALTTAPTLNAGTVTLDFERLDYARTFVVDTAAGTPTESITGIVQALRALPGVESVNPVFETSPGKESLLTDYLYINVSSATPESQVQSLITAKRLEVFKRNDYSEIGIIGYRLKVPKATRAATGKHALDLANELQSDPLVLESAPTFAPLYNLFTDIVPNDPVYPAPNQYPEDLGARVGQWHLPRIRAEQAWGLVYGQTGLYYWPACGSTSPIENDPPSCDPPAGTPRIVVAGLDDGVSLDYITASRTYNGQSYTIPGPGPGPDNGLYILDNSKNENLLGHVDLNSNQWLNLVEIQGTLNADDDGNGKDDDYFGWDFVGKDPFVDTEDDRIPFPDFQSNPILATSRGHGNGTISRAAARGHNYKGVAGVCWSARIMPIRYHINTASNDNTRSYDVYYAGRGEDAINYAVDTGADVLSIMMPLDVYDPGIYNAVKSARKAGRVIAVPAGNDSWSMDAYPIYPAVWPEVIAVGASTKVEDPERRSSYSSYGWALDVVAPSSDALTLNNHAGASMGRQVFDDQGNLLYTDPPAEPYHRYGAGGGTSSSTPTTAGLAALVLTVNPDLCPAEVQAILQWSAHDFVYTYGSEEAAAGRDYYTGWGRLDAEQAVLLTQKARFAFKNPEGRTVMSWDEDGRFVMDGVLKQNATPAELTPLDTVGEFILKNAVGTVVARLDPTWTSPYQGGAYHPATLYLNGRIQTTWQPPNPGVAAFKINNPTGTTVAYIDAAGNMYLNLQQKFITASADANGTYTVNAPLGSEGIVDFAYDNGNGLQTAITAVPVHSIIIVFPGPNNQPYNPIGFDGKNVVVRSSNPYDATTVANTIIQGTASARCVTFAGTETTDCALIGFTIKGGHQSIGAGILGSYNPSPINGTKARIENNAIYGNVATLWGGAIAYCHGVIAYNVIGKIGQGNTAQHGGGLYICNGRIWRNKIMYNQATASNGEGGGLLQCDGDVWQNYIARNTAVYGGGLSQCDGYTRSNLIYANTATTQGGGLYNCDKLLSGDPNYGDALDDSLGTAPSRGMIEHNTIVSNAVTVASKFGGLYDCDSTAQRLRNNIVYWNTSAGSETNAQVDGGSEAPRYCCIEGWPAGNGNISSNPTFVNYVPNPTAPWEEFLHLRSDSPCIDKGETPRKDNDPNKPYRFRDFDHRSGPVDGDNDQEHTILRDMGADEYPTPSPGMFTYWWEGFGSSPE